ncbi:MAG: SpoIID/LytB domain-containing protein [Planctomycetota bacterium]
MRRARIGALLALVAPAACAPYLAPTASAPPARDPQFRAPDSRTASPQRAGTRAASARAADGALALPAHVDVVLGFLEDRPAIAWTDASNRQRTARTAGSGVSVDGAQPTTRVSVPGPVTIDERIYDGELLVTRHPEGGLRAIARVPLEAYVEGVVSSELAIWSASPAELEAQAIAARTFAVATLEQRREAGMRVRLTDGVLDQAFRGRFVHGNSAGARAAARRLADAVRTTTGAVLVRGDRLEEARFHAACGGRTAHFADVFRREVVERGARGPTSVACRPCADRARKESAAGAPDASRPLGWVVDLSEATLAQIGRAFDLGGPPRGIVPARIDDGGRWIDVALYDAKGRSKRVEFDALRRVVGYTELKSGVIAATLPRAGTALRGGPLRIQGRGRGHGVGLCQEGMRDLAAAGWTSAQILALYYPGARIVRLQSAVPTG